MVVKEETDPMPKQREINQNNVILGHYNRRHVSKHVTL